MIEQSLVGAILKKNSVLADVASIVKPEDFTDISSQDVFNLCLARWKKNQKTDLPLAASSLIKKIDMGWLADSTSCGFPSQAVEYAREIAEKAKTERIKTELENIIKSPTGSKDLISGMSSLCMAEEAGKKYISDSEGVIKSFSRLRKSGGIKGLSTGFHFLDRKRIKLVKGNYWAVGAATSVGKTALAMNILSELLEQKACVVVISTEMTKDQMASRLVAYQTDIPADRIIENDLKHESDLEKIDKAERDLATKKFFMADRINDISEIENAVKGLNIKHNIDVVIVDYIQHCTSRGMKKIFEVVSDVSNRLQRLAKDVDAAVIGLSQISNSANKENKSGPPVVEFKGSGDIAADCDVGIIMTKLKGDEEGRTRMVTVVKNRHGRLARNALKFTPQFSRMQEIHDKDNY